MVGIFSRIGEIALNAILDADLHLGETVAVFGLGVIGLLVAQLARLYGGPVIAVDGLAGASIWPGGRGGHRIDSRGQPAEPIKVLTEGRGADVCFEVSGGY